MRALATTVCCRTLLGLRFIAKDSVNIDNKETEYKNMKWFDLAQIRIKKQALLKVEVK